MVGGIFFCTLVDIRVLYDDCVSSIGGYNEKHNLKLINGDRMTGKRFTVHIRWFNYDKTEGDIELKDNGQPILMSESIDDVQWIKTLLNELHEENKQLKQKIKDIVTLDARDYNKLYGENEQLKKDSTVLILANQDYRKENEELRTKNNAYIQDIEVFKEENTHLKLENEQLKERIEFIFEQIKAFREDCRTYQDFDGASTLNRLIEILEQSMEIFK